MNTLTKKLRTCSISLAVIAACSAALPAHAADTAERQPASKQENIGVATGFAVGAAAGGPIGALVGAAAGALIGDRYHKQEVARTTLASDLQKSEHDRMRLTQNVSELNSSLAHEQEHGEKLDLALSQTDAIETEVTFRTNDDAIQTQSLSPLMKIGALAASLPDAKIRVDGYADPRGSEAVNDALSKRRADAVAKVLQSAGVAEDHLVVASHGKSAATSVEGDLDGYAFERRVTVRIERTAADAVARND